MAQRGKHTQFSCSLIFEKQLPQKLAQCQLHFDFERWRCQFIWFHRRLIQLALPDLHVTSAVLTSAVLVTALLRVLSDSVLSISIQSVLLQTVSWEMKFLFTQRYTYLQGKNTLQHNIDSYIDELIIRSL